MSSLNMLAETGGKEPGASEWKDLLPRGGFEKHRIIAVLRPCVSRIQGVLVERASQ